MLEPGSRSLLSELLRPPAGFQLSHAVGTSFTMTLEAALAIPLSFARSADTDDEVGILGAVRRATQHIDLFAQAGCLGLGTASDLVTVLEPMIHPVQMHAGRLFHPKVWFLEFASGSELRYRFVCSSRNLTNDRTWDAVIALDGVPEHDLDDRELSTNEAMAALLAWLATDGQASPPLALKRAERIVALAESWRGVRWEHPEHVRKLRVHTLGIGLAPDPALRLGGLQAAIVSPFVTDGGVKLLRARKGRETTVISRPEALDRLSASTLEGLDLRVLDDMVDQALEDAESTPPSSHDLRGLHAKVAVHDHAHGQSTILIGSANATEAAWNSNVEVMVEVEGPTPHLGVDAVVRSLAPLTETFVTEGGAETSEDEEASHDLESALRDLAMTRIVMRLHSPAPHSISLWADVTGVIDPRFTMSWRMLSQSDPIVAPLPTADTPYRSGPLALEDITPFIVLALSDRDGRRRETVVVAELLDDVTERGDAIVAAHLTDPGAVARFIRLMLQDGGLVISGPGASTSTFGSSFGAGVADSGSGLLELLVRASASNRAGLAEVEGVLRQLTVEARASALPEGFAEVWDAVINATEAIR